MANKKGALNENKVPDDRNNSSFVHKSKEIAPTGGGGAKANLSNIGMIATNAGGGGQLGMRNRNNNSEISLLSKKNEGGGDSKISKIYGGNNQSNNNAFIGASVYDFIGKNEGGDGLKRGNLNANNNNMAGSDLYKFGGGMNGVDGLQAKNKSALMNIANRNAYQNNNNLNKKLTSPTSDANGLNKFNGF